MYEELVVVALGGNAIKQANEKGTTEEQFSNVDKTAREIARICKAGFLQVITHGNGPQALPVLSSAEGPVLSSAEGIPNRPLFRKDEGSQREKVAEDGYEEQIVIPTTVNCTCRSRYKRC